MTGPDLGIWFVGAFGSVASTTALGLAALRKGLAGSTGLVSEHPLVRQLPLPPFSRFVIGGHDVRRSSLESTVRELHRRSGVFDAELIDRCRDQLAEWTENVVPGVAQRSGPAVERLADWTQEQGNQMPPREAAERIAADIQAFRERWGLRHVILVNLASTEPPLELTEVHSDLVRFEAELDRPGSPAVPASLIYALAAIRSGCSYVNFTPSPGINVPVLTELAAKQGTLYAGQDGKTGETLLKTVLAPMFQRRNLRVLSWVGHNIFGNRDGLVLDDPTHKASKVKTKDAVLNQILGYTPQTVVSIEFVESLDDWKTAWDHVHFEGFLGTKMVLQFTWQGCDSLLAAPLVIDLVRLTAYEWESGGRGLQRHLACFFKRPLGVDTHDFFEQWRLLEEYVQERVTAQEKTARPQTAPSA